MRYQVNDKLIGFFAHNLKNVSYPFPSKYNPNVTSEMPEIVFAELVVKEHHKVPSSWDNKPEPDLVHDGYLLEDKDGVVYRNQYPRASYGQMDDGADGEFTWGAPWKNSLISSKVTNFPCDGVTKWEDKPLGYTLLTRYLDSSVEFADYVRTARENGSQINEEFVAGRLAFHKHLVDEFHRQNPGYGITVEDFIVDGEVIKHNCCHKIVAL